jgi:hypothetical protein
LKLNADCEQALCFPCIGPSKPSKASCSDDEFMKPMKAG